MQHWIVGETGAAPAQRALAGVIGAVAHEAFAPRALGHLHEAVCIGSWSVYQLWRDRPPVMHLSASRGETDCTGPCFTAYRDGGLYRRDSSFEAVRARRRAGDALMLRMHADDAPSPDHRDAIYVRHHMVERLSVARLEHDGSVLAINLYRHEGQGRFGELELERFGALAHGLLASVSRQLAWQADTRPATDRRAALKQRCAALTERELDVLERLLRGMTYDGIAADMGLGVATVKTYRARAFERLGIHFKNELFASFLASA